MLPDRLRAVISVSYCPVSLRALSGWWSDHPDATLGLSVRADSLAVLTQYHRLGFEPRLVVTRHTRLANT